MTDEQVDSDDWSPMRIEFAKWATPVEFDELQLVDLKFQSTTSIGFPQDGFCLRLPGDPLLEQGRLEATFFSRQKRSVINFRFDAVAAFRVLDEHGLTDLWASPNRAKPASATFRVRGHQWQKESFLVWFHGTDENQFSWMIATAWECLEVVTDAEPEIYEAPAVVADCDPSEFR